MSNRTKIIVALSEGPATYGDLAVSVTGVDSPQNRDMVRWHVRRLRNDGIVEASDSFPAVFSLNNIQGLKADILRYTAMLSRGATYDELAVGLLGEDNDRYRERVRWHVRTLVENGIMSRVESDSGPVRFAVA